MSTMAGGDRPCDDVFGQYLALPKEQLEHELLATFDDTLFNDPGMGDSLPPGVMTNDQPVGNNESSMKTDNAFVPQPQKSTDAFGEISSKRKKNRKPRKPKAYERQTPYDDPTQETKRRNAIKAWQNRVNKKKELEDLKQEMTEKDEIISRLRQELLQKADTTFRSTQELTQTHELKVHVQSLEQLKHELGTSMDVGITDLEDSYPTMSDSLLEMMTRNPPLENMELLEKEDTTSGSRQEFTKIQELVRQNQQLMVEIDRLRKMCQLQQTFNMEMQKLIG